MYNFLSQENGCKLLCLIFLLSLSSKQPRAHEPQGMFLMKDNDTKWPKKGKGEGRRRCYAAVETHCWTFLYEVLLPRWVYIF